jgi:hypothetical protein
LVFANRTNKHGGSSANPPAASLNGEQSINDDEYVLILFNDDFRATALVRGKGPMQTWFLIGRTSGGSKPGVD